MRVIHSPQKPHRPTHRGFGKVSDEILTWGCFEGQDGNDAYGTLTEHRIQGQPFDDAAMITFPPLTAPEGGRVETFSCAVAGTGTSLTVVYALGILFEAKGLQPEHSDIILRSYDAHSGALRGEWEGASGAPGRQGSAFSLYGTTGGIVLGQSFTVDSRSSTVVDAYSVDLAPLWSRPGTLLGATDATAVLDEPAPDSMAMSRQGFVVVLDSATATELSRFRHGSRALDDDGFDMGRIELITPRGYGFESFRYVGEGRTRVQTGYLTWVDGTTGVATYTNIAEPTQMNLDPFGNVVVVKPGGSNDQVGYGVYDIRTSEPILTLTGDQASGLSITNIAVANRLLYTANRTDSPVTDLVTQETLASGWAVRPVHRTDGRTIVAVSETTSDGRIQLGCTFTDNYSDYGLSSRAVRISNYHDCPSYRIIDDVNGEFPGPAF